MIKTVTAYYVSITMYNCYNSSMTHIDLFQSEINIYVCFYQYKLTLIFV